MCFPRKFCCPSLGVECRSSKSLPCTAGQAPAGPTPHMDDQHSTGAQAAPPPLGRIPGENKKHLKSFEESKTVREKSEIVGWVGFESLVVNTVTAHVGWSLTPIPVHAWSWQMDTSRDFPSELHHHAVLGAQKHFLAARSQQNYKSRLLHCCKSHLKPKPTQPGTNTLPHSTNQTAS